MGKNYEKTGDEIQTSTSKLLESGGIISMEKYSKRESLAHLLAKCAIKEFIASRGCSMPRSEATVRKLIDFYIEKIK